MAKNTKTGTRQGQVKDRKQFYNSKTKQYCKMNTETGKILSNKSTPYKGVRKTKNTPK